MIKDLLLIALGALLEQLDHAARCINVFVEDNPDLVIGGGTLLLCTVLVTRCGAG